MKSLTLNTLVILTFVSVAFLSALAGQLIWEHWAVTQNARIFANHLEQRTSFSRYQICIRVLPKLKEQLWRKIQCVQQKHIAFPLRQRSTAKKFFLQVAQTTRVMRVATLCGQGLAIAKFLKKTNNLNGISLLREFESNLKGGKLKVLKKRKRQGETK